MSAGYGKNFELKFKEDILKIDGVSVDRLIDGMSGYKITSRQVADFIAYKKPYLFYIELKVVEKGNTLNLQRIRQYELMTSKVGIDGVNVGVVTWFVEHGLVCYTPIEEVTRLKREGYKSIHKNMVDNFDGGFETYSIPGKKKRVFIDSDYTKLIEIAEIKESRGN